jgi:Fe-S-cluster containining protein
MEPLTHTLCLTCGLCCNGVLFADVRPQPGDRSPLFAGRRRVSQPCPAFQAGDCTCAIYSARPDRCRQFECRQLLAVRAGETTVPQALKKIRRTHKLARKLEVGLSALGFDRVKPPLRRRFQQCQAAAEAGALDRAHFARLAELQLAMHQLTQLLAGDFYG